ncbi:M13 family peptidase [soil metagenome]
MPTHPFVATFYVLLVASLRPTHLLPMPRYYSALLVAAFFVVVFPAQVQGQHSLGVDLDNIDPETRPQDDFYRFVNGRWLETTEIPADRPRFGSFDMLAIEAREQVRDLIEEAAAGGFADDLDAQRIAAAYTAYLDEQRVEELGAAPLQPHHARIDRIRSSADLPVYFAESQRTFGSSPMSVFVGQDQRNAEQYAVSVNQAGLGLADRSFYLEERFQEIRDAYVAYLTRLYDLAGVMDSAQHAQAVMDLETRIAEAHWTRVENRDREATYNKMAVSDFHASYPNLNFPTMLSTGGISVDSVIVRQPSFFTALNDIVADVPLATWQSWMRARLLDGSATMLSSDFREAHFDFRGRTLSGQLEPEPRWRQAVGFTEGVVGEGVGRLYVDRHYPPEAEARMSEMIENLRDAFRESILELDWMTEATKAEAIDKLESFNVKIGYPSRWEDYSALEMRTDDLFGNAERAAAWRYQQMIDRLGQPVDRERWGMTPQTVNAYYSPSLNEIVFPAAILQPPFFNVDADDAVNYGGIGAVIGHEFSHGFDDQGRRSDGLGNLRDWWTEEDADEYTRRAQILIDQYTEYEPLPGAAIIGAQTIGENIADLAGTTMAYRAYRRSLNGQEAPVINGFTGDQRFFMGWAQVWRILHRKAFLRQTLQTGAHSPGEFRTNGIVIHHDAFHDAFNTAPGDPMYLAPELRLRIW